MSARMNLDGQQGVCSLESFPLVTNQTQDLPKTFFGAIRWHSRSVLMCNVNYCHILTLYQAAESQQQGKGDQSLAVTHGLKMEVYRYLGQGTRDC